MADNRDLIGSIEIVAAPTWVAVSLNEARKAARIDHPDEDTYLATLIDAAQSYVERVTGRQLSQQTIDIRIAGWWDGVLRLPRSPLQSVTSVKYFDTAGTEQTLSSASYIVRVVDHFQSTIEFAPNITKPTLQSDRREPVTIRVVTGYTSQSAVPAISKRAIAELVAHWYEHRESVVTGTIATELPLGLNALLLQVGPGGYS